MSEFVWGPTIDEAACTGCRVCLDFCQSGLRKDDVGIEFEILYVYRGNPTGPEWRSHTGGGRQQALAQLADDAADIAESVGCAQEEAVAFLLAGWIPMVPWINVRWDPRIPTATLCIAMSRVTPKDVSEAYSSLATRVFGDDARERSSPLRRVDGLLAFIGERFPDGEVPVWREAFDEFDSLHPGAYKTPESMRTVYRRYQHLLKYHQAIIASDRGEPLPWTRVL